MLQTASEHAHTFPVSDDPAQTRDWSCRVMNKICDPERLNLGRDCCLCSMTVGQADYYVGRAGTYEQLQTIDWGGLSNAGAGARSSSTA